MTWWIRGSVLAATFVIACIAAFPLRMAWDVAVAPAELTVGEASGTIWSGRLQDVRWRGAERGDFDASLSPIDLFPTPAVRLANGSGPVKSVVVRAGPDELVLSDATISVSLSEVIAGAPPDLSATIGGGRLTLRAGRCTHAAGTVASPAAPALGLPAFAGTLACDRGALLARVNSQAGDAVLEISPAFDRVAYRSASPMLQAALAAVGIPASPPES